MIESIKNYIEYHPIRTASAIGMTMILLGPILTFHLNVVGAIMVLGLWVIVVTVILRGDWFRALPATPQLF